MKKVSLLFIVAFVMVMITGCGSETKMTCTRDESQTGVDIIEEDVLTFKNNKIVDGTTTTKANFEKEEAADIFEEKYQSNDDVTVKRNGNEVTVTEKDPLPDAKISPEDIKTEYEADGWTCTIAK